MADVAFAVPARWEVPTGGNLYDRRLAEGLAAHGWHAAVMAMPPGFPHPDAAATEAALAALAAVPARTVVLADCLVLGALPAAHLTALGPRLVALCHHPLAHEAGLEPARAAALAEGERAVLAAVAAVVVTSPATAASLAAEFAVPAGKITVALPGTAPRPRATGGNAVPTLLTVGSLIPRKGHDVLIDALATLADRPWRALFVGSAELDPEWAAMLRRRVDERGLGERVEFLGPMPPEDLDRLFAAADLFVLLSAYEGYGKAFAEALSAELPVVATTGGAIAETVPADAGILVAPGDAAAAAAAIARLLDDPDFRAGCVAGARAAAAKLPRWEGTAAAVATVLARVAERAR